EIGTLRQRQHAAGAVHVDAVGRGGSGQAALEGDNPGDVGGLWWADEIAKDEGIDLQSRCRGAVDQFAHHPGGQIIGRRAPQLGASLNKRCAHPFYDRHSHAAIKHHLESKEKGCYSMGMYYLLPLLLLIGWLWPESAWAWGPSAHLSFGLEILE